MAQKSSRTQLIPISSVIFDDEFRIRQSSGKNPQKLRASIDKWGYFHPIVVNHDPNLYGNDKYKLCSGYLRLQIALDKGMEDIMATIFENLTRAEELEIEKEENESRYDFNRHDRDRYLALKKEIHEKEHPELKWGGNIKKGVKGARRKNSHENQRDLKSEISLDEEKNVKKRDSGVAPSFVEKESKVSGKSRATIARQVQIGKGLLSGDVFTEEEARAYKNNQITQDRMLKILKERANKTAPSNKNVLNEEKNARDEKILERRRLKTGKQLERVNKACMHVRLFACRHCFAQLAFCVRDGPISISKCPEKCKGFQP